MWAWCEIFFSTVLFGIASHFKSCRPLYGLVTSIALCCAASYNVTFYYITLCCAVSYHINLNITESRSAPIVSIYSGGGTARTIMHVTSCHNWAVNKPPVIQQCSSAFRPVLHQQQQPCTDTIYTSSLSVEGHFLNNHITKEITKQMRLCLKKVCLVITPIDGYQKQLTVMY